MSNESKQSSPMPEKKFFIDEISPMVKAVINKEMSVSKFVELLNEIANRDIKEWMKENPPFSGGK